MSVDHHARVLGQLLAGKDTTGRDINPPTPVLRFGVVHSTGPVTVDLDSGVSDPVPVTVLDSAATSATVGKSCVVLSTGAGAFVLLGTYT